MREGKGQKCKGLSFDSKVHADPEAESEEEEEKEQGGSGDEAYLAVQVGEEARDGALMSESDGESAPSDGEWDGAVESDSNDEGADVPAAEVGPAGSESSDSE